MKFATDAQRTCYETTAGFIKELFGESAFIDKERPLFAVRMGSALAQVWVFDWGDADATIEVKAFIVRDAELTPELLRFLLEKNGEVRLGAFGLDRAGTIFFAQSLPGSACDKSTLRATMMAIMHTADRLDDEIVSRWGGKRQFD